MDTQSALSVMPGHLIRRLNQRSTARFQHQLRAAGHDITPVQFAALTTLVENPGLDQATLAGLIAYDRATIGGVVKRLEQKGLIQRQTNTDDRRAFRLFVAPKGRAVLKSITPLVAALQTDILSNLSDSERRIFMSLVHKALNIDPSNDQPPPTRKKATT